jgi:hypothetical protein
MTRDSESGEEKEMSEKLTEDHAATQLCLTGNAGMLHKRNTRIVNEKGTNPVCKGFQVKKQTKGTTAMKEVSFHSFPDTNRSGSSVQCTALTSTKKSVIRNSIRVNRMNTSSK